LAASELPPPPLMALVMACPATEPIATPAAVVAIWANIPGCLGAGAAKADGGAWAGTGAYERGGGGAAALIGGGEGGARLQQNIYMF